MKKQTLFQKSQTDKQWSLLQHSAIFDNAKGDGLWWNKKEKKWETYPWILQHQDSLCNLYNGIRENALVYFEQNDIVWWRQNEDRYFPTGHLLSSQNHCLNHLFSIHRDKNAVLAIIKALCPRVKDVLPSPIDNNVEIKEGKVHRFNSYITFEFTCDNHNLLNESGKKRGEKCTSVDALVYAVDNDDKKVLMPIEWKYTEAYEKTKDNRAFPNSVKRYVNLANMESSNLEQWILDYEWDPLYEFARQELLMEQIIAKHPLCGFGYKKKALEADDFVHIIVRPNDNVEIKKDITAFRKTIVDKSKLIEIDPQEFLSPLKGDEKYSKLLKYLEDRYWK